MDLPRLRLVRQEAVMSQEELAERSGVARDTSSKLETGRGGARGGTLRERAARRARRRGPQHGPAQERAGPRATVSSPEPGRRGAYPSTIRKLAASLDVQPRML